MTVTAPKSIARRLRGHRINEISADAVALGVTREHLQQVLRGKRQSDPLRARYLELKQSQKKERMSDPAKLSPGGRVPMPIEFAALQNLQPSFFQTLTALGLEVVLVRIDTSKNTPPGAINDKVVGELDRAIQPIAGGEFDSEFYPLHSQCLFFHLKKRKLGAAMRKLKDSLQALGLLEVSEIFHAESPEYLMTWHPATAEGIEISIEPE